MPLELKLNQLTISVLLLAMVHVGICRNIEPASAIYMPESSHWYNVGIVKRNSDDADGVDGAAPPHGCTAQAYQPLHGARKVLALQSWYSVSYAIRPTALLPLAICSRLRGEKSCQCSSLITNGGICRC